MYTALTNANYDATKPAAYLNYIVFDDNYNVVTSNSGAMQMGGAASTWNSLVTPNNVLIGQPGYLLVCSSSGTDQPGYFDDVNLTLYKGNELEEDHYYPFGLTFSSTATGNNIKYNGKEIQHNEFKSTSGVASGLEWYDYGARMQDPQLGRWFQMDPLAEVAYNLTPYRYGFNNPVRFTDPNGMDESEIGDNLSEWSMGASSFEQIAGNHDLLPGEQRLMGPDDNGLRPEETDGGGDGGYDGDGDGSTKDNVKMEKPKNTSQNTSTLVNAFYKVDDVAKQIDEVANPLYMLFNGAWGLATGKDFFWGTPVSKVGSVTNIAMAVIPIGTEGNVLEKFSFSVYRGTEEEAATAAAKQYTKSNLKLGREMHTAYKAGMADEINTFKEYTRIPGIRPDFVDFNTKTIYELKPFNPRAMRQGMKQLEKYKSIFEKTYPGTAWKTILDTY